MNLSELFEEYRIQFILGLAGLFLLGVGVLSVVALSLKQSEPKVEIISSEESVEDKVGEIVVDVEGAVEKPGVYKLGAEARVNDALVAAGGVSAGADSEWIAKYVNLAQPLADGVKIYIPQVGEQESVKITASNEEGKVGVVDQPGEVIGISTQGKININSASSSELDSLWGIGEKRAAAIIENRPYGSIEELLEKKIVPSNVFDRIEDQIGIY
jgi:competence protein ComEA